MSKFFFALFGCLLREVYRPVRGMDGLWTDGDRMGEGWDVERRGWSWVPQAFVVQCFGTVPTGRGVPAGGQR